MNMFGSLEADAYDRQYTDWELAVRIASRFRAFGRSAAVLSLLTLLMAGASSLEPMIVAYGIDRLRDGSSADATVPVLCLVVLVVGVGWWLLRFFNRRVSARLIGGAVRELQMDAFSAAIGHDLSFFDQYSSGGTVSRITSDTQDFSRLVELVTWQASGIVQTVILSIVLWRIEPSLTLILFAMLPFVALFAVWFRGVARKFTRRGMRATAGVNDTIKETVSGIAVAKNFRREQGIYDEFSAANHRSYGANLARGLLLNMVFPVMSGLGGIAGAFLLYIGGRGVVHQVISMGAWYLFLQSLERFMYPLLRLTSFWTDVQTGLAAAERVFALVDAEHSVKQTGTTELTTLRGEVRFEHVDFSYRSEEPVLSDFNLDIVPGETVAFVGHTGAGKSSIARLLARFYEFQGGRLLVDGHDIRTLDLRFYRQQLGHVAQTPFLFSGTVGDNIRYGCPNASDEEVWQLARSVGEGAWLDALPNGLDTPVGERGGRLSMGQRQLVALIRVLLRRPAIFILDEATASVDPFTECQIREALEKILAQTTGILIAHRLSTVKSADRIIVLEQGRIVEQGRHEALLATGGQYADLYNTYFRHQSLEYVEQAGRPTAPSCSRGTSPQEERAAERCS